MSSIPQSETPQTYGLWTVIGDAPRKGLHRYATCRCECGNIKDVRITNLKRGVCQNCGCAKKPALTDLTGQRFGRLIVLQKDEASSVVGIKHAWVCQCDCGNRFVAASDALRMGIRRSCGCYNRKNLPVRYARTRWRAMKARCQDPTHVSYPHYGGRGIAVCARWQVFENYYADMGDAPEGLTLDRIDNEGNYEPSNCRWADRSTQVRNQRPRTKRVKA